MPYRIAASSLTDTGLVRVSNEDAWGWIPEISFYVLADGMGGHQAGEVASKEAVAAMCRLIRKATPEMTDLEAQNYLKRCIEQVNGIIYHLSRTQERLKGMGTTLCCLQFMSHGVLLAHVGDSRIYRLRKKKFDQLTVDHSLLRELMELGQLEENQATDFLYKNILTKAIGTEATVEPTLQFCDVQDGDVYLMCSDGLSDEVSASEIQEILQNNASVEQAAKLLVSLAKQRGGHDNITAMVMRVVKDNGENGKTKDQPR